MELFSLFLNRSLGATVFVQNAPMINTRPLRGPFGWIEMLGLALMTLWMCLSLYGSILIGRQKLDLPAFTEALRQSGLSMLPAITLVMLAAGLILGVQIETVLEQLNLPSLILLSATYGVLMQLVPILVGILVAGRAGVALAVRQATMLVTGEMDGLLVIGINPLQFTVGPVLLAMLLMSFAFAVWGTLVTFAASYCWLWIFADIPPSQFLDAVRRTLELGDLAEALAKPLIFALLIALIASVNGTNAGRTPEGISEAATRTMIGAVSAILLADLLFVLLPWDS